jgi:sec-independent protein translocase protein TatA
MSLLYILGLIGGLGTTEILLIVLVLLLFFGGKRIPELAKGLGKGIREFKDASNGKSDDPKELQKKD